MVVHSPHKIILFGEHAVVYGYPALSATVDLFAKIYLIPSKTDPQRTPFVQKALDFLGLHNVYVKVDSTVPSGSGMGTSSMIIAGILLNERDFGKEQLARQAFEIEYDTQGLGSPIDTTTIVSGGFVLTNGNEGIPLWKIEREQRSWQFASIPTKNMDVIIVYTGSKGSTRQQVSKVKKFYERGRFARDIMQRIGDITEDGVKQIVNRDLKNIGELMNENHEELKVFGLTTERIEKVISIGKKYGYGAKLTGAGGGGSVLIIPREKEKLVTKLKESGFLFFDTSTTGAGIFKTVS